MGNVTWDREMSRISLNPCLVIGKGIWGRFGNGK